MLFRELSPNFFILLPSWKIEYIPLFSSVDFINVYNLGGYLDKFILKLSFTIL